MVSGEFVFGKMPKYGALPFSRPLKISDVFKDKIETRLLKSREEGLAKSVVLKLNTVYNFNSMRNRKLAQLSVFVAPTHEEFAKKYYSDYAEGQNRDILIAELAAKQFRGIANVKRNLLGLNLQEIRRNCENDSQVEPSIILTTMHLLMHHYGDFGPEISFERKKYDAEWLNEGVAKSYALSLMQRYYPAQFSKLSNIEIQEYSSTPHTDAAFRLAKITGAVLMIRSFFISRFAIIERKINEAGANEEVRNILRDVESARGYTRTLWPKIPTGGDIMGEEKRDGSEEDELYDKLEDFRELPKEQYWAKINEVKKTAKFKPALDEYRVKIEAHINQMIDASDMKAVHSIAAAEHAESERLMKEDIVLFEAVSLELDKEFRRFSRIYFGKTGIKID